jgi:hypothetical protein
MRKNEGTERQATDGNMMRRMRSACWMTKATDIIRGIFAMLSRGTQNALYTGISLHRGPVGEPGGGSFAGIWREKKSMFGF